MVKSARHKLMRIDVDLSIAIRDFATKNQMSFVQASREIAKLNQLRVINKKSYKGIKI